ncbi:MAG: hypothetical protein JNJ75_14470 [Cyclobacteriaceae bacterium]|nr:hypothetical protein [Cyclobacteriaceae bacterium]
MDSMHNAALIGFPLITVIFYYLLYREFRLALPKTSLTAEQQQKFTRRLLLAFFGWLGFVYIWSRFGIFSNFSLFPFNAAPVILIPLITIVLFTFSKNIKEILPCIPQENIIKLQVFRFYVEVLLWALFSVSILPVQMTFEGRNFDVITGVTAVLLTTRISGFMLLDKMSNALVIAWNILGLALLINIVVIAILSMPTPLRVFMNEPANTIVTEFPISMLPAFLVPLAYMLHLLSIRKAAIKK